MKIRVFQKPFLVSEQILSGKHTRSRAHNQLALLIDLVEGRHCDPPSPPEQKRVRECGRFADRPLRSVNTDYTDRVRSTQCSTYAIAISSAQERRPHRRGDNRGSRRLCGRTLSRPRATRPQKQRGEREAS